MFSFLNRDALWVGVIVGLLVPFVGYAVLLMLYEQVEALGWIQKGGLSIVAICLNLWPLNVYQKKRFTDSMRGIVLPTGLYVIIWVVYFFGHIFGS
jgi:hypothetical protein